MRATPTNLLILILASCSLLLSCSDSSPTATPVAPNPVAAVSLVMSPGTPTATALSRADAPDTVEWSAEWMVTVNENAGVTVDLLSIESRFRDDSTGVMSDPVVLDSSAIRRLAGTNRLAGRSSLSLRHELDTAYGFAGGDGTLIVRYDGTDTAGRTVSGASEFPLRVVPPTRLVAPIRAAVITQNDATLGCTFDPNFGYGFGITFDWEDSAPANGLGGYELVFRQTAARVVNIEATLPTSELTIRRCNEYVATSQGEDWLWRVRVLDGLGNVSTWSELGSVDFQPCRDAGVPVCQ